MKTAVIGEGDAESIVYNCALLDLARHYGSTTRMQTLTAKTKGASWVSIQASKCDRSSGINDTGLSGRDIAGRR